MDYAQAMAYIDGCQRFVGNKDGLKNIEGLLHDQMCIRDSLYHRRTTVFL